MSNLLHPPPYRSAEWQEWRRSGLGASEVAVVIGQDPYQTPYQLAARKRGLAPEQVETEAMRWGIRIESMALDAYEERQGVTLARGETWGHERWPHLWATLDGRRLGRGVEVKATTRWRVPPLHVQAQAQAQMGLADLEAVDIVRVTPYGAPEMTTLERDEPTLTELLDTAEAWAVRYVAGAEMPPPDGSPEARLVLDRLRGEAEMVASTEQEALARALRDVQDQAKQAEQDEARIRAALKATMAGHGRLIGEGWHIVWSAVAPRRAVAWQRVAEGLRRYVRPGEWDELVTAATTLGEPTTRLTPHWEDEP